MKSTAKNAKMPRIRLNERITIIAINPRIYGVIGGKLVIHIDPFVASQSDLLLGKLTAACLEERDRRMSVEGK